MNIDEVKMFLDTCYAGSKINELMADLPLGLKRRHIHVIDAIYIRNQKGYEATISDVCEHLNVTMPSVTKLVNELEEKKALIKHRDNMDKRIVYLELTDLGLKYYRIFIDEYLTFIGTKLSEIPKEDIETTIRTLRRACNIMIENQVKLI